jgi:hypothetical protein
MVLAVPPFGKVDDAWYKLIECDKLDLFWATHLKLINKEEPRFTVSEDLKELIGSILNPSPYLRPSLSEVVTHPWVQREVPSDEEIRLEFIERLRKREEKKEKQR